MTGSGSSRLDEAPEASEHDKQSRAGEPLSVILYISNFTPNSVRAEANLAAAIARAQLDLRSVEVEVVDVFSDPRRALMEGVIVTPTLIILVKGQRRIIVGDLANADQLELALRELRVGRQV